MIVYNSWTKKRPLWCCVLNSLLLHLCSIFNAMCISQWCTDQRIHSQTVGDLLFVNGCGQVSKGRLAKIKSHWSQAECKCWHHIPLVHHWISDAFKGQIPACCSSITHKSYLQIPETWKKSFSYFHNANCHRFKDFKKEELLAKNPQKKQCVTLKTFWFHNISL